SVAGLSACSSTGAAAVAIRGCGESQTGCGRYQANASWLAQTTRCASACSGASAGCGVGLFLSKAHAGGEQQTTGQQGDCLFFHFATPQISVTGLYPVHSSWAPL